MESLDYNDDDFEGTGDKKDLVSMGNPSVEKATLSEGQLSGKPKSEKLQ